MERLLNIEIQEFIKNLKNFRGILSKQTIKTLKGQALSGDLIGANKGLLTAIKKRGGTNG